MNDLIIIGAGPGGYELAIEAAKAGLKVVLVEKGELGGTCLNAGCIPTKSYYKSAEIIRQLQKSSVFGIEAQFKVDFLKVKERKERVVQTLKEGILFQLKRYGIHLVKGSGKLVGANVVAVEDFIYEARHIVIATGSSPVALLGFSQAMSAEELLDQTKLPRKLVIIGGGVIGIEMASIYHALGVEVEVVESQGRILSTCDEEISKRLLMVLRRQGIKVHLNAKALGYLDGSVEIEVEGQFKKIETESCLVAVGRKPSIAGLGLEKAGVEFDEKGITVDDHFKTNVDSIYAVGDVTGRGMLAHTATYAGLHVLHQILGQKSLINFNLVPNCVFSFPEVSWVGLREEDAKALEIDYKVFKGQFQANGKAQAMHELDGMVKLIVCDDRLIGGSIFGANASILIHEVALAIQQKLTRLEFLSLIRAHPTLSEIFSTVLR